MSLDVWPIGPFVPILEARIRAQCVHYGREMVKLCSVVTRCHSLFCGQAVTLHLGPNSGSFTGSTSESEDDDTGGRKMRSAVVEASPVPCVSP